MSKAKGANCSRLLREMAAVGIPVDLSVAELDVRIEQVGGLTDSIFFDLPDGRAGCMIDLFIINQTSRPILLRDVELRPPWSSSDFQFIPDPREAGRDQFNYNFPGKGTPVMPRDQVINHVLLDHGILKPQHPVEGWLLGIGNPKPEKLLLGRPVEVALVLIGDDHREYDEKINLWIDPVWKHQPKSPTRVIIPGLFASKRAQNLGSPNLENIPQNPARGSAPAKKDC